MDESKTTTVQITRHIDALPEHVYDAWLDAGKAAKFLFSTPAGRMVRAETNPKVGGSFHFTDRREGDDIEHTGKYIELVRPTRIAFTFWVPKFMREEQSTKIYVDISPTRKGCSVTLRHEGVWADFEEKTKNGWEIILDGLADSVR